MESANLKFHQARQTFCNPIEEQPELILYWYICVFVYLWLCICVFVFYVSFMYLCIWKREHGNLKFHQAGLTFHIPLRSRRNWAIFANTTSKLSARGSPPIFFGISLPKVGFVVTNVQGEEDMMSGCKAPYCGAGESRPNIRRWLQLLTSIWPPPSSLLLHTAQKDTLHLISSKQKLDFN